jgi:hypothetical protein
MRNKLIVVVGDARVELATNGLRVRLSNFKLFKINKLTIKNLLSIVLSKHIMLSIRCQYIYYD